MRELTTYEGIFRDMTHGLEPWYAGRSHYGEESWEYIPDAAMITRCNTILTQSGIDPADRVEFFRLYQYSDQDITGEPIPAQETLSVSLYNGKLERYFRLDKYDSSEEITVWKHLFIEDDHTEVLIACGYVEGSDLYMEELAEYSIEMHQISGTEFLALSGLAKLLLHTGGSQRHSTE